MPRPRPDTSFHDLVREIVQVAMDLEAAEREAFVEVRCGNDAALRSEVDSLLASFERAGGFLEGSALDAADAFWIGRRIGGYRILRLLGRGGVGLVFEAEQDRPRRVVALKVLRPEVADEGVRRRFDVEAELLGMLDHPGIAHVYGAGTVETELGPQSFLAMENVGGRSLLAYADGEGLDARGRVRLIRDVCDAVQHAHERGVIHRDLKPGNVLVDRAGRPKVLDFGVARATNADLDVSTIYTQAGQLVGTVSYMSPEQARGEPDRIDARTDVYSLGVMLYRLLAGRLPLPVSEMTLPEAIRTLGEDEPPPLSVVVRGIDRDLATVVDKAIAREPERRYESAADLARDLERYLADEPVLARPPSTLYQLRKLAVRNRLLVSGVAALVLVLTLGVIVTSLGQLREKRLRIRSEKHRAAAVHAQRLSEFEAYAANLAVVEAALASSDVVDARSRLDEAGAGLRGWEWTHLRLRLDRSEPLVDTGSGIESMGLAPDGRTVVTGGTDCTVRAWDLERRELLWETNLGRSFTIRGLAVGPAGELVAAARGSWFAGRGLFGPVTLLSLHDGSVVAELEGHDDVVQAFEFHPSEPLLFSAASDGTVRAWNLDELREERVVARHDNEARDVRLSPDARRVASAGWDGHLIVVDTTTWETVRTIETGERLTALGWSADGGRIALGTWDGHVLVADLSTGALRYFEQRHTGRVERVRFTPDGRAVLSCGAGGTLESHELPRGVRTDTFLGSTDVVTSFFFEEGRGTILSGALDGWIRRWDARTADVPRLTPHEAWVYDVAVSSDDRHVASAGTSARGPGPPSCYVMIHDLATREVERELVIPGETVIWKVDYAPDSDRLLTAGSRSGAVVWDAATGERLLTLEHDDELRCAEFDPTGELLATTCRDRRVRLWSSRTGELVLPPLSWEEERPFSLVFSPDGRSLAVGYYGGGVAKWDARTGALMAARHRAHEGAVYAIAYSPDGRSIASGGSDGRVQAWDARTLLPSQLPFEDPAVVVTLAFFPDGERLAVGDRTGLLRILETDRWRQVVALRAHHGELRGIDFDAEGRFVYTGASDGEICVWDGGSAAERLVDACFGELPLADDVVARIRSTPDLAPDVRSSAIALAEARRLAPDTLAALALEAALDPDRRASEYAAALRRAQAVLAVRPDDPAATGTLGALLYRTGELDEALRTLDRATALRGPHPLDGAFRTLTLAAQEEPRAARDELERLETLAEDPEHAPDHALLTILAEARAALAD